MLLIPATTHSMSKYDPMVAMGLFAAPAFGDGMKIHIKDVVSSCMATGWVKGKQTEGVPSINNMEIARHLSCRPFKLHDSMFAEDAIKAGLKGYEAKTALSTTTEPTSGEKAAAAATMATTLMKNRLRPLSPHLSIYKPHSFHVLNF